MPDRREQRFLYCNGHGFFKPKFYWSIEQLAAGPDYAWGQFFVDGLQYYDLKSFKSAVRAVRRKYI